VSPHNHLPRQRRLPGSESLTRGPCTPFGRLWSGPHHFAYHHGRAVALFGDLGRRSGQTTRPEVVMSVELTEIDFYTPSLLRTTVRDVINVGPSDTNVVVVELPAASVRPRFSARRFPHAPDTFDLQLVDARHLQVRRTDAPTSGWGGFLVIDVEDARDTGAYLPKPPTPLRIPRTIYQTFKTRRLPSGMRNAVDSWKSANRCWEHYFYDDDDCIAFIRQYFGHDVVTAYLDLIPGAFKADLWRCCVLIEKGGVYADADMICLASLDEYLQPDDEFLVARDDPMSPAYLFNAFIASTPQHAFLQKQLDAVLANVRRRSDVAYLHISGPGLLGQTVNACLGRDLEDPFSLGRQVSNEWAFNILRHEMESRSVLSGETPVVLTEYASKADEMDALRIPTYYRLYQSGIVYQHIPRRLFYTSEDGLAINQYMVESFTAKNPHWTLHHYSGDQRSHFFREHRQYFIEAIGVDAAATYERLGSDIEKADFWRYAVIFRYGGAYADTDTYCAKPLDDWIHSHDLIVGLEAFLPADGDMIAGLAEVSVPVGTNSRISMATWAFAAEAGHPFLKALLQDICRNPLDGGVLVNTGPGRFTRHVLRHFDGADCDQLAHRDIHKGRSVLCRINRFGANQRHSNAYWAHTHADFDVAEDVYIVHMFAGTWRSEPHRKIKLFECPFGVSHNLTIRRTTEGYRGVARFDPNPDRTVFMTTIGDCRSLLRIEFDDQLTAVTQIVQPIANSPAPAKFEDFRYFGFQGREYLSVSYIDAGFNTRMAVLDDTYTFLGDICIDDPLNRSALMNEDRIWEKNWLLIEKSDGLYLIYSTLPDYVVYRCVNFASLLFTRFLRIDRPFDDVPDAERYPTGNVSVGGSTNPIFLEDRGLYLYFVHTKIYHERRYNHYAVLLDSELRPIRICPRPVLSRYLDHDLLFLTSVVEHDNRLVCSGGIDDRINFVWELSKPALYRQIGI